jgi:hypothetical protein
MSFYSNNWSVKAAGVYLSEADPLPTPNPFTHCMNTYPCTYGHREGEEGGGWTCEKVRGALVHTRGVENTNMTDCIYSLYTLLNTSNDDI